MFVFAAVACAMWLALLLVPWRPWSTRERLELGPAADRLHEITVLIPARNEAVCIGETLRRLGQQGTFAAVVVIDDQSTDATRAIAEGTALDSPLTVIAGQPPPPGWSGKLWALEQGRQYCRSPLVLLLDADIGLERGVVAALQKKLLDHGLVMASVMANLHMRGFWERLLLPPFIYFFKLIYPFALANSPRSGVAAGAGGCVLLQRNALESIGGFGALRDAIIDDCTLARLLKRNGGRIWIGLSNDARALRPYDTLSNIWNMVARTAYTQLHYSPTLLLLCTGLLIVSFCVPLAALTTGDPRTLACGLVALLAMFGSYLPTLRYYELKPWWALTLPIAAILYLAMTWTSALRYARGERSRWKDRSYETA